MVKPSLKCNKGDSKLLCDLKNNQNKLTTLDVNFLIGKVPEKTYKKKREILRKKVTKIINKSRFKN